MSGKKPKSVSFNEKNKRDKEILDWIEEEGICFAAFTKDLYYAEMLRRKAPLRVIKQTQKGGIKHVVLGSNPPPSKIPV